MIERKTKQLNTRVTPSLMLRIEVVLAEDHISTAQWLTNLIDKDLRRREKALNIKAPKKTPRIKAKPKKSKYDFNH